MSGTSTFLLLEVPIAISWIKPRLRWSAGWDGDGEEVLIPFLSCGLSIPGYLPNLAQHNNYIYVRSKPKVHGSPINASDGCVFFLYSLTNYINVMLLRNWIQVLIQTTFLLIPREMKLELKREDRIRAQTDTIKFIPLLFTFSRELKIYGEEIDRKHDALAKLLLYSLKLATSLTFSLLLYCSGPYIEIQGGGGMIPGFFSCFLCKLN